MSFDRLQIKRFRRLADVDLELRPLAVLIGANGIGKTSLLDALLLLSRSASGALNQTLSDFGGLAAVTTLGQDSSLELGISMAMNGAAPLLYSLCLQPQGIGYSVDEEYLSQQRDPEKPQPFRYIDSRGRTIRYFDNGFKQPTWDHNPLETSLAQVPRMYREPENFRHHLASAIFYHVLDVSARSPVRLPQPMRPALLPGADGQDLVSRLFGLREAEAGRYEAIEDSLRAAFPGFDHLNFPPVAAGTLALTWSDSKFPKPFYAHQLSEGMLRFLWLATLLQSGSSLSSLTLLDEPEVSLHPELLNLLADLLRGASRHSQVVVATHSDRLIRALKPSEVVVMDMAEDGTTNVRWADDLGIDFEAWMRDYTLDELWSNGRLGARA